MPNQFTKRRQQAEKTIVEEAKPEIKEVSSELTPEIKEKVIMLRFHMKRFNVFSSEWRARALELKNLCDKYNLWLNAEEKGLVEADLR